MQAAYITRTGDPSVIEYGELPTPEPGPTEVLVKVKAAAVNPIDTYIRAGIVGMATKFPYILGCDLAGVVKKCGSQVQRFQPGDRVWGSNQSLFGRPGTFAEYAAVDEQWLYPTPPGQTDAEAAAGALVGITAHLGLFLNAGLKPGELVFVNGGAGGVGSAVIQLAKAAGATVVATAGRAETLQIARDLGADLAVDYHDPKLDETIRDFAKPFGGINVWFETQREPTLDRTVGLMAKRGRIILMAGRTARPEFPVGPFYVNDLRMFGFAMFNATSDEQRVSAEALNEYFRQGKWKPQIGLVLPLSEARQSHEVQEANTLGKSGTLRGKIVVTV